MECISGGECYKDKYCQCVACQREDSKSASLACYIALVDKLDEYIQLLTSAAAFAAIHGACSKEEYEKGMQLRGEISELRKAI